MRHSIHLIRVQWTAPSQRGFALVEVLTAGLVLALAALGLSATLANGSRLADGSREEMLARDAIRDTLARIAETPFDKVALNFHHGRFSAGPLPAVADDPDGWPGEVLFEPGPEDSRDVYRVTIRMRWKGAGGERVIESVHYLANVRGDPGVVPTMDEVEQAIAAR